MGKSRKRARSPSRAPEDGVQGGSIAAAAAAAEPVAPRAKTSRKHVRKNRETSPVAEPAAAKARRKQTSEVHGKTKAVDKARAKKRGLAHDGDDAGDTAAAAGEGKVDDSAKEVAGGAKGRSGRRRAAKKERTLSLAGQENRAEAEEQNDDGDRFPSEAGGSSTGASAKRSHKGKEKSIEEARKGTNKSEADVEAGTPGSEVEDDIPRKTVAHSTPADKDNGSSSGREKKNAAKGGTQDADEKSKQVGQDSARLAVGEVPRHKKRNKGKGTEQGSEGKPEVAATAKKAVSAGKSTKEGEDFEMEAEAAESASRKKKDSKGKKRNDESEVRRNEDAKGGGGKVGKSKGAKVDTVNEVDPTNTKSESQVKSRVNSGKALHGKQRNADSKKNEIQNAEEEKPAAWNDWSQADFDGDAARKNKFMCLMGARKSGSGGQSAGKREKAEVTSKEKHDSTISPAESKRIQDDLQKQFEGGMAARRAKRGKNRGIGFKS